MIRFQKAFKKEKRTKKMKNRKTGETEPNDKRRILSLNTICKKEEKQTKKKDQISLKT